ncbi:MAG: transcription-repair coupling factor, partial [Pseudomonadota bacterium]
MTALDLLSRLAAPTQFGGAPFGMDVIALTQALDARGGVGLYVARDDKMASAALQIVEFTLPTLERVHLPGWDTLPYDRISPSASVASARCSALATLAAEDQVEKARLIVTTASALVQRVPPIETMRMSSLSIGVNERIDQTHLSNYLKRNGYIRTATVSERGEFAMRGGKIDLYSPNAVEPVRLDLFGDEVEAIKAFDPETQLSTRVLKRVTLAPVSEILFDKDTLSLFRERYLAEIGSPAGDSMYEAARAEIRRQGLENWLPLF